jgi:hypothetical protein
MLAFREVVEEPTGGIGEFVRSRVTVFPTTIVHGVSATLGIAAALPFTPVVKAGVRLEVGVRSGQICE